MDALSRPLACPACRGELWSDGNSGATDIACSGCAARFPKLEGGYPDLRPPGSDAGLVPFDHYLEEQTGAGARRADRWLVRLLRPSDRRALDVGCGTGSIGLAIEELRPSVEVWGVDLPGNLPGWQAAGADPSRVVAGSATHLPFADHSFDIVWSLGVVEHIGEPALPQHRAADRARYVAELLRVTRPGGRALVVAPHKWFPLDPAHVWTDSARAQRIYDRTHLTPHRTWGPHALLSYRELSDLARAAGATRVRPVSMADYFSFDRVGSGAAAPLVPLARGYLKHLPARLGATPLAPFLAVEIAP